MKSAITISLVEEARGGPFVLWDGLEKSIAFAGELGYDAVEIFAPSVDAIDADALGKMLDKAELKLCALGTGAGWVKSRLQLADVDAGKRKEAREFVRSIIDLAAPFGASAISDSSMFMWNKSHSKRTLSVDNDSSNFTPSATVQH